MPAHLHFRDLRVWDAARLLAEDVHAAARGGRRRDRTGVWNQACRSAESIGANIAEGCGRTSRPDRMRFFAIALGSLRETQHHLRLCCDLGLLDVEAYRRIAGRAGVTRRMLMTLMGRAT
ncbi:MAG TPA: four helix bundle protein [Gemmatimonadaceae bacterium]|jgi:four helix bundle protein|nr:four helix bundle protein [Gemmatimonadaceae bacterium]